MGSQAPESAHQSHWQRIHIVLKIKNNTRWQFIVTHKVKMRQQGESSQKLRPRRGWDMGRGRWPKGDAANVTHENKQRTRAPGPIPAQSYSRKPPHTEAAPVLLLSLCKKALEPIFWNQRLLNTHTKKQEGKKRAKKKKKRQSHGR